MSLFHTVSLFHWDRRYPGQADASGTIYCPIEHGSGAATFEEFMRQRATESPERVLNEALRELWRCSQLPRDRYRRLRCGLRRLLAALLCLLATVGLAISLRSVNGPQRQRLTAGHIEMAR